MSCVAIERLPKYANCTEETMHAKENLGFRDGRKKKVQVGKDQEMAQSEKDSHSKNLRWKKN